MTKLERSRAKQLENTICLLCGKLNRCSVKLAFTAILILIIDALILIPMTRDDELYVLLDLHVVFLTMLSNLFVTISDAAAGDPIIGRDMGNQTFVGSAVFGKLLCTMPYEAKDVLDMRLLNWERHMTLNWAMTSVVMLMLEVFSKQGYTEYDGITGAVILIGLVCQIISLPLSSVRKNAVSRMVCVLLSVYLSMLPCLLIFGAADETGETSIELATAFSERLGVFSIASGVPGVLILAALTAVSIAAAEFICGRIKKFSWNIRG